MRTYRVKVVAEYVFNIDIDLPDEVPEDDEETVEDLLYAYSMDYLADEVTLPEDADVISEYVDDWWLIDTDQ